MADHKSLDPLLLTKLQRPLLPQDSAPRPRLLKSLARILDHPLTLVSAPAGFGKSTLVAQALAEVTAPAAWLTVDEYDNDLRSFLNYLIAAIQTQIPNACAQTQRLVGAVQLPSVEYVAASLLNEMAAIPQPFIVVIDDFHYLSDPAVDQLFMMLLRAVPAPLHLVVLTQTDPGWPLARLIGRGHLLQLRSTDLRFRVDEAEAFLEIASDGTLPRETVTSLVQRTEGWIVALRLAALTFGQEPELAVSPDGSPAPADRLTRRRVHERRAQGRAEPVKDG